MLATESITATQTKFHVGLHVSDLSRSVRFYRALLGAEPAKHFDDYAKFELAAPPLVLALYPSPQQPGGPLNHVGLRLPDSQSLVDVQRRLEEAGIETQRQDGVECCYSKQTKFWVSDPDKTLWEIYVLEEDADHSGFENARASDSAQGTISWQHRITEPLPERIPHPDQSLDDVILEGTINNEYPASRLREFFAEAFRSLKPGGKISIHGLVSDKPFPGKPTLPGLASLVQRVPVEGEAVERLREAGFVAVHFEKLGDIHCFNVNGVELREMRVSACRPANADSHVDVMYLGPHKRVAIDTGVEFLRGIPMTVTTTVASILRTPSLAPYFVFLVPSSSDANCCC